MKGLQSRAYIQEARMLLAAQETAAKEGQRQVGHELPYRNRQEKGEGRDFILHTHTHTDLLDQGSPPSDDLVHF